MTLQNKIKPFIKLLKVSSLIGSGCLFIYYHIDQTLRTINRVVNHDVLDMEKKHIPEYIYIADLDYENMEHELRIDEDPEIKNSVGLYSIWKNFTHSVAWRLVWLCRHGNPEQRNKAITQLAGFKNNKDWEYLKLAQAIDKNTAVLLAHTQNADIRYFLPPPIHVRRAALTPELISYKFRDLLIIIQNLNPHYCIEQFLSKYFFNVQEHAVENENIPRKPDSISERELCLLCLDAINHHLSLFTKKEFSHDNSVCILIKNGILAKIAELILRNSNDSDIDLAVLKILTTLSVHKNLLDNFYQNGIVRELCRMIKSKDLRISSSAAVCLANLSGEGCYRPGLFLLHPLYRTRRQPNCDILLIHGLRGGVFVTWRQRDKKCSEPVGLSDVTYTDNYDPCQERFDERKYLDPDVQALVGDLIELEDESIVADLEVVLHDVPISAKRESNDEQQYTADKKLDSLAKQDFDRCNYTQCWPKDWLPKDCKNIRVLGVNYWSSLSEWLEPCPLQMADIATRAEELTPILLDADVGKNAPVVWLTHSMGGLIIKQILISASSNIEDKKLAKLCEQTKAIFFFSTPHKGSAVATLPRAAAAILWPSPDVKQLQVLSPVLLNIHKEFIKIADFYKWETISFVETKPTLITAFKVPVIFVESSSADIGRGLLYELPLDHLSICKPATRQSVLYKTVLDAILRVTKKQSNFIYSNSLQELSDNIMYWIISAKNKKNATVNDQQQQKADRFKWFELLLLNSFTDG